jgi:archaellum component FlaC
VDARYSKSYQITEEELEMIGNRIKMLKTVTFEVCRKKIEGLRHTAKPEGHTNL